MRSRPTQAFTLLEVLASMAVLSLLILFTSQLVRTASNTSTVGTRRIETDAQARISLDRMALDFAQMTKRTDVDVYLKSTSDTQKGAGSGKNDLIAFFAQIPGNYPAASTQSPLSLISYRVNSNTNSSSYTRLERMGKGLLWSGNSSGTKGMLFGYPDVIKNNWASAVDSTTADSDYEVIGSSVFRFEYFYLLKTGILADSPAAGLKNVSAIAVTIAVIDSKSRALLSNSDIVNLSGQLQDFDVSRPATDLLTNWQIAINSSTLPRAALAGIRFYQRYCPISPLR